ncbi:MAG: Mur ligase family protein, partial [Patescibacteria group bacterium]
MLHTYSEASKYLESLVPPAKFSQVTMSKESIQALSDMWGSPHTKFPIIHIGGTSGKTSTATFAAAILQGAGLKTGLSISPHLEKDTERMQINGNPIPETEFVDLLNELLFEVEKTEFESKYGKISRFGALLVLTFKYFVRKEVAAAVIEVGLGGKLDGTNIILPSLAVLTNVSLDHTEILGKTVQKIAIDKIGIIKRRAPAAISAVSQPTLQKLLIDKCKQMNVPLYLLGRDFQLRKEKLSALGDFQHENFTLAAEAVTRFVRIYFPDYFSRIKDAINNTAVNKIISGRMEVISQDPLIVLDGAHNGAKMKALCFSLRHLYPKQKWITLISVKKGKSHRQLIRLLEPFVGQFIFSRFTSDIPDTVYVATDPKELAAQTRKPNIIVG